MKSMDLFGQSSVLPGSERHCAVEIEGNNLVVNTPYQAGFVTQIKSLPYRERSYDPARKAWLVDRQHSRRVAEWIQQYFRQTVKIELPAAARAESTLSMIECHYVTLTKQRGGDERDALGLDAHNQWTTVFPESVLRKWFMSDENPGQAMTLYGVLGIRRSAEESEIKRAYRRMVMQWHPDHCKEANAGEMFMRIQDAYNILSQAGKRARYDAGMALEASLGRVPHPDPLLQGEGVGRGYRSPLRCGMILAEGRTTGKMFVVEKITAWEDIRNSAGQILTVSWVYGEKAPRKAWV